MLGNGIAEQGRVQTRRFVWANARRKALATPFADMAMVNLRELPWVKPAGNA